MKKILAAVAWMGATATVGFEARAIEAYPLKDGERIVLDGRIDEAAWGNAQVLDRFWEISPEAGAAPRVATEARFAYDRHAIYVAIRAHDPDMSRVRAPFARRDKVLSDQDLVVVNIDPVGNRKFAQFFRVNPRGAIGDGLWNEDSATEDFSPDFPFEAVTGTFEGGWTAELRIPFSSLRFADPPSRQWSVLVFRNYPREQRYRIASSPLPRDMPCFLCLNQPLTGLDAVASARHLEVTPQVTLRGTRDRVPGSQDVDTELVPSLDVKWRPRADLVFDATINPDFSQVELDTPQLAANAQFALLFPEKRPFFLEGADMFEGPFRAIYTRSITDPAWGARATQRSGRFDATVLVTQDDGGGLVLLPGPYRTDFARQDFRSRASFARGRWQVGGMTLGALATDRTLEGGAYNRVAGADLVWFATTENRLRSQVLGSWTTAHPSNGTLVKGDLASSHAVLLDWSHRGTRWDQYLNLEDVGGAFRADNGFFGQNGYRRVLSETARKFLGLWGFNEVTPYLNAEYKTTRDGELQYRQQNVGVRFGLPRATMVFMEARIDNQVAVRPGGGVRKRDQGYIAIESNPFPWFALLFAELAFGDRIDVSNNRVGKGTYLGLRANFRPHPRAELEYSFDNDIIDARGEVEGSRRILHQRVQQLLAIWHLGARDSVRTIWQAASVRRSPSLWEETVSPKEKSDALWLVFSHRRGLSAAFHVGASHARTRDAAAGVRRDQSEVFAKWSWTFDVL